MKPLKYLSNFKLIVFPLAFAFSSCTHYYYTPSAHSVPLFQMKNQFKATIGQGGNDEVSTTDIHTAYSITKNIAVMANAMFANGGENSSANWGKGNYFDGAIGFYKPFSNHWVFEIFTGFGNSAQHHQYNQYDAEGWNSQNNDGTADLYFTKFFVQPSIGLTFKNFDIALTAGVSSINFYRINNSLDRNNEESYKLFTISQNHNSYLFEHSITLRAGSKYIKGQLQILLSENLSHSDLPFLYNNVSFGLTFQFRMNYLKNFLKANEGKEIDFMNALPLCFIASSNNLIKEKMISWV